jgi:hypothetical protein
MIIWFCTEVTNPVVYVCVSHGTYRNPTVISTGMKHKQSTILESSNIIKILNDFEAEVHLALENEFEFKLQRPLQCDK